MKLQASGWIRSFHHLRSKLGCSLAFSAAAVAIALLAAPGLQAQTASPPDPATIWTVPEVGALPRDAHGMLVREGRDLVTATYAYVGPNVSDPAKRFAGNNLACTNCHLQAGIKKYGIPLFGLRDQFPQYSARTGASASIEDRLNSCFLRSMNGRTMPEDAPEMRALVAYINFLSTGVAPGVKLPGLGTGAMPELDRAADPARGQKVYARACIGCHNTDGSGAPVSRRAPELGYMIPPLWGPESYNDGAGMARLITFANFVHFNMPHGADYLNPQLSVEEAWDVAAYVNSQPRPKLAGLDRDFPNLLLKPVDAAYGPYADGFSEKDHKYGPFAPIRAAIEKLKQEKAAGTKP